jgi:RHS repeat-associated protein
MFSPYFNTVWDPLPVWVNDKPFTCGTGSDRVMVVIARWSASNLFLPVPFTDSLTYNGAPLTYLTGASLGNWGYHTYQEVWYLVNPPSGTHPIRWRLKGEHSGGNLDYPTITVMQFSGVDQSNPIGALGTVDTGTSSFSQFDITTNYNNSLILYAWSGTGSPAHGSVPAPAGANVIQQQIFPYQGLVCSFDAPTPGHYQAAVQPVCNCNNSSWVQIAFELVPSGATFSIPPPAPPINLGTGAMGSVYSIPHAGDPVNLVSGNFSYQAQDISIARHGLPIEFTRYYNSHAVAIDAGYKAPRYPSMPTQPNIGQYFNGGIAPGGVSGPMGFGWSHSYDAHIIFSGLDSALVPHQVYMPDGSMVALALNGDGTFAVDPSLHASFSIGSDGSYSLTLKDKKVWQFNASGRLVSITDRNLNQVSMTYIDGLLASVSDTNGTVALTFTHNGSNQIASVTDALGRTTTYGYDSIGNLIQVAYPAGPAGSYTYDDFSNLTHIDDPKAPMHYRVMTNTYGILHEPSTGNHYRPYVISQKNGLNQTVALFSYGADGTTFGTSASVTDANGNVTTSTFTTGKTCDIVGSPFFGQPFGNGLLLSQTNALGHTGSNQYNDPANPGIPSVMTDREGHSISFSYDSKGNPAQIVDAMGFTTHFTFDTNFNVPVSVVNPLGHAKTYGNPDSRGNFQNFTDALGHQIAFSYDTHGRVLTRIDANGGAWSYGYDGFGNLSSLSDPLNHTLLINRDAIGRPLSIQDANGNVTQFTYDALDRITRVDYPDVTSKQFTYDGHGNLATFTDQNGHLTQYQYDVADRLVQSIDASGHITLFTYDAVGNMLSMVDANGHATEFTYDALNRVKTEKDAKGSIKTYAYTPEGRLQSIIDGNGQTRLFTYDANGRLTGDGPDTYIYDAAGRRVGMGSGPSLTTYTYDAADRLLQVASPGGVTMDHVYDPGGRRTSLNISAGSLTQTLAYQYDVANRLTAVISDDGATQLAYDSAGNLLSREYPNGVRIVSELNPKNYRVTRMSNLNAEGEVLMAFSYTHDPTGNRLSETDLVSTKLFQYDALHQVMQVSDSLGNTETYSYDSVGNRLSVNRNGQVQVSVPNPANELQSVGGIARLYDGNGNLVNRGGVAFGWDIKNRLTTVGNIGYTYDGNNLRVQKTVNGVVAQRYFFDGMQTMLVLDGAGEVLERYNPGISFVNKYGQRFYYLYNPHGDVVGLTDKFGSLVQNYRYTAFGQNESGLTDRLNQFKYVGGSAGFSDEDTGLIYMVNRWYDPSVGMFISRDPIGLAGGSVNLYSYAGNNPVNRIDPIGLSWFSDLFSGGCGGGGGLFGSIADGFRQLGTNISQGVGAMQTNFNNGISATVTNFNNGVQRVNEAWNAKNEVQQAFFHEAAKSAPYVLGAVAAIGIGVVAGLPAAGVALLLEGAVAYGATMMAIGSVASSAMFVYTLFDLGNTPGPVVVGGIAGALTWMFFP